MEELIPKGGIFDGPFGSNLKSDDYTESGVRVIRLENIGQLRFISEKETFISREKYETLKRHTVGEGDIIFASFIMEGRAHSENHPRVRIIRQGRHVESWPEKIVCSPQEGGRDQGFYPRRELYHLQSHRPGTA